MKRIAILTVVLMGLLYTDVQAQTSTVLDGIYIREHTPNRRVIPYPHLREADVMWLKRVWREIDLRQKMNHTLYYPTKPTQGRKSMFSVIEQALDEGSLTAYSVGALGDDDMFTVELTKLEVLGLLNDTLTQYIEDPDTGEMMEVTTVTKTKSTDIKRYALKEEWFFDNQRSVLDVRIIGIAPIKEEYNEYGEFKGNKKLFWIYYPQARYVFRNADVYARTNDAERRTIEDIIWKRQFNSYITKETNVYDRTISEYKMGLDALLEAEDIHDKMFFLEHDLWHF